MPTWEEALLDPSKAGDSHDISLHWTYINVSISFRN